MTYLLTNVAVTLEYFNTAHMKRQWYGAKYDMYVQVQLRLCYRRETVSVYKQYGCGMGTYFDPTVHARSLLLTTQTGCCLDNLTEQINFFSDKYNKHPENVRSPTVISGSVAMTIA